MMYGGMMGGMIWGSLLAIVLLLGFAYIIWVLAAREKGGVKIVGQVIAIMIVVLAAVILLYGTIYGGMVGRGSHGYNKKYDKTGPGMMRQMDGMSEKEQHEFMKKWVDKYKK
ncbi:MAG: hypothetical protein ABIA67_03475 [Candidatus Margulisiibacteriota bacterium]